MALPCLLPHLVLLCLIILVASLCHRLLHPLYLIVLCPSPTLTFPSSPCSHSFTLFHCSLFPLGLINCHSIRTCSFESFHVSKWHPSSLHNSLLLLEVVSICNPHLVALISDESLSLSPIAEQQPNLPNAPMWNFIGISKAISWMILFQNLLYFTMYLLTVLLQEICNLLLSAYPTWSRCWNMPLEAHHAGAIVSVPKHHKTKCILTNYLINLLIMLHWIIKLHMDFSVTDSTENVWRGKTKRQFWPATEAKPLPKSQLPLVKLWIRITYVGVFTAQFKVKVQ